MNKISKKGYIHFYTGNGKGKTTAAIGQIIRALGAGYRVLLVQFMKDFAYSELNILEQFHPQLFIRRYGNDRFVFNKKEPSADLQIEMKNGLRQVLHLMQENEYDMVVLDEIFVSVFFNLFDENEVRDFIQQRPEGTELILTGRYCPPVLYKLADLITEMQEIKHYYKQGVGVRRGIES